MQGPIDTTHELLAALKLPPTWHGRTSHGKRQIHPATRLFQVLGPDATATQHQHADSEGSAPAAVNTSCWLR